MNERQFISRYSWWNFRLLKVKRTFKPAAGSHAFHLDEGEASHRLVFSHVQRWQWQNHTSTFCGKGFSDAQVYTQPNCQWNEGQVKIHSGTDPQGVSNVSNVKWRSPESFLGIRVGMFLRCEACHQDTSGHRHNQLLALHSADNPQFPSIWDGNMLQADSSEG